MRIVRTLALALAPVLAAACASAPRPPPPAPPAPAATPPARPATGLHLVVHPPDAEVEIEGVRRGRAATLAADTAGVVPLAPGVYRVSVQRPGHEPWRAEVSVVDRVERIDVTLVERPR
jgi:hypothetical protein